MVEDVLHLSVDVRRKVEGGCIGVEERRAPRMVRMVAAMVVLAVPMVPVVVEVGVVTEIVQKFNYQAKIQIFRL